jgi:hypothetical protein
MTTRPSDLNWRRQSGKRVESFLRSLFPLSRIQSLVKQWCSHDPESYVAPRNSAVVFKRKMYQEE